MFGSKRDEAKGGWRKVQNAGFLTCTLRQLNLKR
jgi:hypothetical protein